MNWKRDLAYNPETGVFTWLVSYNQVKVGDEAGYILNIGYRMICKKLAHHLAWFFVHGEWPLSQIDHINGDRLDNRIVNLRLATWGQNARNAKLRVDNRLGVKGIRITPSGRYEARLAVDRKCLQIGTFLTLEDAVKALKEKRNLLHGEFARH
jgi:hypothetical protein